MTQAGKKKRIHKSAAEREKEIISAATRLFAERGYQVADMEAIAAGAEVGKGTVYRYFPTKEQLFKATLQHNLDELRCRMETAAEQETDPLFKLRELIRTYLRFFEERPEVLELFVQERAELARDKTDTLYFTRFINNREQWLQLFKDVVDHYPTRDVAAETLMDFCTQLIHGALVLAGTSLTSRPPSTRVDQYFELITHGLLAPDASTKALRQDG